METGLSSHYLSPPTTSLLPLAVSSHATCLDERRNSSLAAARTRESLGRLNLPREHRGAPELARFLYGRVETVVAEDRRGFRVDEDELQPLAAAARKLAAPCKRQRVRAARKRSPSTQNSARALTDH